MLLKNKISKLRFKNKNLTDNGLLNFKVLSQIEYKDSNLILPQEKKELVLKNGKFNFKSKEKRLSKKINKSKIPLENSTNKLSLFPDFQSIKTNPVEEIIKSKNNKLNTKGKQTNLNQFFNKQSPIIKENNTEKYKSKIAEILVENELLKRKENYSNMIQKQQILGEPIIKREGSKFNKIWLDSNEIYNLKQELNNIISKKSQLLKEKDFINNLDSEENNYWKEKVMSQNYFLVKEELIIKNKLEKIKNDRKNFLLELELKEKQNNCLFANNINKNLNLNFPLLNEQFKIICLIEKSENNEIYKAYDIENLDWVILKIYKYNLAKSNCLKSDICHYNIVFYIDQFKIKDFLYNNQDDDYLCDVLEYCDGWCLKKYLNIHNSLSEIESKKIIIQILNGLKYLSDKNIINYNLEPKNIFINKGIIKISNYLISKNSLIFNLYTAPELINSNNINSKVYEKNSIWSLGIIYYEILYGFRPLGNFLKINDINKFCYNKIDFPDNDLISSETKIFIQNCLNFNIESRFTIEEAIKYLNKN